MQVRLCALLILALLLLSLPGCWGSKETDEVAYPLVLGFDKGEKDNLVVTMSIANPKVIAGMGGGGGGGGGGGEGGKATIAVSVETYAPLAAIDLLNTSVNRRISLMHAKTYVFSEELAREGLNKWISPLLRYRELRTTSLIVICRGKAKDFIEKNNPMLELSPTKQFELVNKLSNEHGLYLSTQLLNFYEDLKSQSIQPSAPLVASHEGGLESAKPGASKGGELALGKYIAGEVPISGGNKSQVIGTAVFRGDKLVGTLDGQETRYYMMLRGLFRSGIMNVTDPLAGDPTVGVGLLVHQARSPEYKTSIDENGNVSIDVELFLEPEIIGIFSDINYERPDLKPILEEAFSRRVEQGCQNLLHRTQEEMRSDIIGFGNHVKHHFLTVQSWRKMNWLGRYPDAQVNVSVHTKVRRTGLMAKTIPTVSGD